LRGWQAKAAQKAGVDLASLYRRVTRLGRNSCAPRDAGPHLTRDEITRAAQKALEQLTAYRVGRALKFRERDIEVWLERQRVGGVA
jgi:hypothetical protein